MDIDFVRRNGPTVMRMLAILAAGGATIGDKKYTFSARSPNILKAAAILPTYELDMKALLRALLPSRSGAFVDVGANIGQTLLRLLELDPTRRYVGIEPQPSAASDILSFIVQNRLRAHDILSIGLSDDDGFAQLGISGENDVAASINLSYRPDDFYSAKITVPVFRGDRILRELDCEQVGIIKVDVEGAEAMVLNGFSQVIGRDRPCVIFEVLPNLLFRDMSPLNSTLVARRDEVRAQIHNFFGDQDYVFFLATKQGRLVPRQELEVPLDEVDNYLAVPSEQVDEILAPQESTAPIAQGA